MSSSSSSVPFVRRRELEFQLYESLRVTELCDSSRFAMHDRESFDAMLDVALRLAGEKFADHAARLDREEPTFDGERVHVIEEVGEALRAFAQAGLVAAPFDEADGGLQLPYVVTQALMASFYAANTSTAGYVLLTMAAANLLTAFGTDAQKARFVAPMLEGRFLGTMCLSETGAGSSLSALRTRAEPVGDGRYRITGAKMWISGGEHELSENIVHLVLARLPEAPPGVKGISLFVVPRHRVDDAGRLTGESNDITLAGLNHKMGYRGTVNTVLHFGDSGECLGELVGRPHEGLRAMFHMMNEARVGVGLGAAMLGHAGYLYSLDYARGRVQGRHPDVRDGGQVAIIEHADVRRMLLAQRAWVEGALSLSLYCARLIDEQHLARDAGDESAADEASLLLEILTPIAKAWPSEWCLEANKLAIQVLGGYGYTRDYPVERLYRDNRLNMIHEGTNGIQALDLLGRKVTLRQGAALRALMQRIESTCAACVDDEALAGLAEQLRAVCRTVTETTMTLAGAALEGRVRLFLANASAYLELLGHTVIAWRWLSQARVARGALGGEHGQGDRDYYRGKLQACRYFFAWDLPKTGPLAERLAALDDTTLSMEPDWF